MSLNNFINFLITGFLQYLSKYPTICCESILFLFFHIILPLKLILCNFLEPFFLLLFSFQGQIVFDKEFLFMVQVFDYWFVFKGEHLVAFDSFREDFLGFGVKELNKILFQNIFMVSLFDLHDISDHKGIIFGVNINVL